MPHPPIVAVVFVTEAGRVSESNTDVVVVERGGRVRGGNGSGDSLSLRSLMATGLSYVML